MAYSSFSSDWPRWDLHSRVYTAHNERVRERLPMGRNLSPLWTLAPGLALHVKWHADSTRSRQITLLDEGSSAVRCSEAFRKNIRNIYRDVIDNLVNKPPGLA